MRLPTPAAAASLLFLAAISVVPSTSAQSAQGVLATGSLPACGQTCATLSEATQTCNGATSSSQAVWSCFCQRVYSASASYIDSGTGLCADTCTSAADQQSAVQWFKTECGSDNGASEHADSGTGGQATTTTQAAGAATTTTSSGSSETSVIGDGNGVTGTNPPTGGWWDNHWKWIVMLIVLLIGLSIIGFGGVWLKRRHDRKRDQISSGFNEGITTRSTNNMTGPHGPTNVSRANANNPYGPAGKDIASGSLIDQSGTSAGIGAASASQLEAGSGRNSPARTRDAFMPFGYGYARSGSPLATRGDITTPEPGVDEIHPHAPPQASVSPGARAAEGSAGKKGARRIMVRERSG